MAVSAPTTSDPTARPWPHSQRPPTLGILAAFDPHAGTVRFYFGVLCGARDTSFEAFVSFVHSKLDTAHVAHGEVTATPTSSSHF